MASSYCSGEDVLQLFAAKGAIVGVGTRIERRGKGENIENERILDLLLLPLNDTQNTFSSAVPSEPI